MNTQKGFSFILIILFGLVFVVGWFIWQSFFKDKTPDNMLKPDTIQDHQPLKPDLEIPNDSPPFSGVSLPKSTLNNTSWLWQGTNGPQSATPKRNDFIMTFNNDGSMNSTTDCNNLGSSYINNGNSLSFGDMFSTLMYCEESQEQVYFEQLRQVESFKIESDTLFLYLQADKGVMIFKEI